MSQLKLTFVLFFRNCTFVLFFRNNNNWGPEGFEPLRFPGFQHQPDARTTELREPMLKLVWAGPLLGWAGLVLVWVSLVLVWAGIGWSGLRLVWVWSCSFAAPIIGAQRDVNPCASPAFSISQTL